MLKTGKLDSDLLEKIVFNNIKFRRPEVLTRPGIGEDCAVVDFGSYECIMSTDPITAAISEIGRLSIHISCNDIASNGIQPLGIMLAVMLPEGTTEEEIEEICKWIKSTLIPGKLFNFNYSSYSLKRILECDTGIYLTNNEFKDAMQKCGFKPDNPNDLNWCYRISNNSPACG